MEILEIIGILLGVALIIAFVLKGVHIMIAAPVATFAVVLLNQMPIAQSLIGIEHNEFMGAFGNYIANFLPVFLLGAILAKFMEDSGATTSIAESIVAKIGTDKPYRAMVSLFVVSFILSYGGISIFVIMFALIPLARSLFKRLNMSWNLIQVPLWLGVSTVSLVILPGAPSIQNVIPTRFLGTTLVAAAIPSIIGALFTILFGLWYMKYNLKKSQARGEVYATYVKEEVETTVEQNVPPFLISITPLIGLIVLVLIGSNLGNEMLESNIIYIALLTAISLSVFLFRKHVTSVKTTFTNGAISCFVPIFATSSAVAFGAVITSAQGFTFFSELIASIPGTPLISLAVLTSFMSAVTGSASGALGIIGPTYAVGYVEMGLNPELIHRVASIASVITAQMPQSGVVLTFLALSKLNYKNGYKEGLITIAIGNLIALVTVIILGSLMMNG